MNLFRLIERNMRRNVRRTLLTAATVAMATFIFTVLISVPASMDRIIHDASGTSRLIINNRTGPWYGLPARYCSRIREMPGCRGCVAVTGLPSTYQNPRDVVFAAAVDPEVVQVFPDYNINQEMAVALLRDKRAAIAGQVLVRKHNWKIGQLITLHGADARRLDLTFVLVGQMPSKRYPNLFLFRRDYLREALKAHGFRDADIAWQLVASADSPEHLGPLAKEIDDDFRNSEYETRTITESDALSGALSAVGNIRAIVYSLCAIVILTVLLIAANSTAMMVRDRLSEVAVMRVLGFTDLHIGQLLFGECALIGLSGGLVGACAAFWMFSGGITLGAALGGNGALWVMPGATMTAVVVAIAATMLSGVLPILSALRIPPALAVREVV